MSEYKLEVKQTVSYPRCRIYRKFIKGLIEDRNIRLGGSSDLFYYIVLCSIANFRPSNRCIDGIWYTVQPGEWIIRIKELNHIFRNRRSGATLSILDRMQKRHLITYTVLGHGNLIKYKIEDLDKHNRVFNSNAFCPKDIGFFFIPISIATELVNSGKCSETDALLDMWINTIYNDERVDGSKVGPVVYYRNCNGNPLISYDALAKRWGVSKATAGRHLRKLEENGYIDLIQFQGTHGTAIFIKNYLSVMFEIPDVVINKNEVAISLNIEIRQSDEKIDADESVSNFDIKIRPKKALKPRFLKGFSAFEISKIRHILSDCKEIYLLKDSILNKPKVKIFPLKC